jgi:hypothetical protein
MWAVTHWIDGKEQAVTIPNILPAVQRIPDLVNGSFEAVGGVTTFFNCLRLYKDKEVKGVVWQLTIFYTVWAIWNMYYYPHLNQWLSFWGGLVIVLGNLIWITQVIYYRRRRPG